jgi:PAS domain S-box-containing protein
MPQAPHKPVIPMRSFIIKLFVSVFVINLLVMSLAGFFLLQSRQQYISRVESHTQNLVNALERTLSSIFNKTDLCLLFILDEAASQQKNGTIQWNDLCAHVNRLQGKIPELISFQVVRANGDLLGLENGQLKVLANIADREHFITLRQNDHAGQIFSKPIFGRVNKKWIMITARRLNNQDGSFAGIVQGALSIDALVKMFASFDLGTYGVVTLRDADLDVIARHPASLGNKSTIGSKAVSKELRELVKSGEESGTYISPGSIDTMSRTFSFRKLSGYPLYVNAGRSSKDFLQGWHDEVWKTGALCLLFAIGSLFTARLMFLKWKNARLSEVALHDYNDHLEKQILERTSDLNHANEQLRTELTERQRIEEALVMQERHLKAIIDTEPDCVKLLDRDGALLMMNPAGLTLLGADTFDEVKGTYAYTLVAPEHQEMFIKAIEATFSGTPAELTFKIQSLKGGTAWLESHVVPLRDSQGTIVSALAISRDVTEKVLVEEETTNTKRRMACLLRISQHPFTTEDELLDKALHEALELTESSIGYIFYYDQQSKQFSLSSWSPGAMQECTVAERRTCYELDHTGIWGEAVRQRRPIILNDFQVTNPLKKGYPEGHVTLNKFLTIPVLIDDVIVAVIGVANKEKDYTETDVLQLSLLMDSVWKITARKRADEERLNLEKQLLHTQKLESLGVLAGGIAHDFNNILTSIIGNADLALMRLGPESPVADNLHRIELASSRAADLARQMLAYSGKGHFVIERLDVNKLLEEMLHMVEVSISKRATLRLNLSRQPAIIEADASQMHQVVMNLVINASEALGEENGTITVTSGTLECDRIYLDNIWPNQQLPEGTYVVVDVADTGCGMSKETTARIFDPFFTTKFTGRGLGMAAVFGIIKGHKGAIKVYSEEGKGSLFKILLPASTTLAKAPPVKPAEEQWQGNGTVLLVDDEEFVRSIGTDMLKELGFEVVTAEDGQEALDIYTGRQNIDIVILDLTMPRLDGEQTFHALRALKPAVKVIISSGYNEQDVTSKFAGMGLAGFVQKPYKFSVLRDALRKLTDTPLS